MEIIRTWTDNILILPLTTQNQIKHSEAWMYLSRVFSCWKPF